MKFVDTFRKTVESLKLALNTRHSEDLRLHVKGEVFMTLRDGQTGEIQEQRHIDNLVVWDASILLARLLKDNVECPHGAFVLAVGTGDSGWDLQNPPAPTKTQRCLYNEIARKRFETTTFVNAAGMPVSYPTNVVDYTTVFSESEAVGPCCEMSLLGGTISANMSVRNAVPSPWGPNSSIPYDETHNLAIYETAINYLTFKVLNKPATSTLGITWRLST